MSNLSCSSCCEHKHTQERGPSLTPYGDRFPLKVDSIVLMLKSRYLKKPQIAHNAIKTGFSDMGLGGAWGRIYPALCLRDGITQDSDCSVPMTDD